MYSRNVVCFLFDLLLEQKPPHIPRCGILADEMVCHFSFFPIDNRIITRFSMYWLSLSVSGFGKDCANDFIDLYQFFQTGQFHGQVEKNSNCRYEQMAREVR